MISPDSTRRVVFFDLDKTLIHGHSQTLFMKYLLAHGLLSKKLCLKLGLQYFAYELGILDNFDGLRRDAFSMLKGISVSRMNYLYDDFFKKILAPRLRQSLVNIIHLHKSRNDILILITASMKDVAERVSNSLGIDYTIATELEIKDSLYTGAIVKGPIYADEKARAAKSFADEHGFSLIESYAYTDHISDLPLLFLVDNPVAVSPDFALRRIAHKMGWLIIC